MAETTEGALAVKSLGSPASYEDQPIDDVDEDVVDFDGPHDLENPINWSPAYKWSIVIVISIMSLVV